MSEVAKSSLTPEYAQRLARLETVWWKRLLDVQRPYRWNIRRQQLGFVLDVGCGLGRNLLHLQGNGIGVDLNPDCVQQARAKGLECYETQEFESSAAAQPGRFDALLLSHVLEHLTVDDGIALVQHYLRYIKPDGKVMFICPQEKGYASDATHVQFANFDVLKQIAMAAGLTNIRVWSFPFPRWMGKRFTYNEFNLLATKPAGD